MAWWMRCNSSLKPLSSKRSASSSTTWRSMCKTTPPLSIKSSKRPGVATSTEAPARNPMSCVLIDAPPTAVTTRRGVVCCMRTVLMRSTKAWLTCCANSRVGTSTTAYTPPPTSGSGTWCSGCNNDRPNAKVLPDPVGAKPMPSFAAKCAGITRRCTGVADSNPSVVSASSHMGSSPKASKDISL